MKLLISVPSNCSLVIDGANAGVVAQMLSHAVVCNSTGYGASERWSQNESGLEIKFLDDSKVAPLSALEQQLDKQQADANSARWKEYSAHQETKKKLTELEAQIDLLKSVTVCTVAETETPVAEDGTTTLDLTDDF